MRRRIGMRMPILALLLLSFPYSEINAESTQEELRRELEILDNRSHDHTSFTQGLEVWEGSILESSGLYGHSRLSEVNIQNGEVIRQISFDDSVFAEGITVRNNSVIVLTWREGTAFEIDLDDFSIVGNYSYEGEGWGICYNGEHLVMSNGSSYLSFRDPESFEISHSVRVTIDGEGVTNLNELECVGDIVYANVWMDDSIIAINSTSGHVEFFAIASSLSINQGQDRDEVLNGIAYDDSSGGFWITGKNWTEMYLVKFYIPESDSASNDSPITIQIVLLFTGMLVLSLIYSNIQRKDEPEKPNFKDYPQ
tara:strand:- start:1006 stop:1935 length:930 start_codon:yes stop_codon:yes gene_type:complete